MSAEKKALEVQLREEDAEKMPMYPEKGENPDTMPVAKGGATADTGVAPRRPQPVRQREPRGSTEKNSKCRSLMLWVYNPRTKQCFERDAASWGGFSLVFLVKLNVR